MTGVRALTAEQLAILDWVREFIAPLGLSPSIRRIARQFDISTTAAHAKVQKLIAAGKLQRVAGELRLIDQPDLRAVPSEVLGAELARRGVSLGALNPRPPRAYGRHAVTCAADSCGVEVRRGHLMCREHWFSLPGSLCERIMRLSAAARYNPAASSEYQDAVAIARDLADGGKGWGEWSQAQEWAA